MKRILIVLMFVGIALSTTAQQLSTSGESSLKFYNKAIERLQKMSPSAMGYQETVMDAEKKIQSIKKTDPGYDVSSLEAEVKAYKEKGTISNPDGEKNFKDARASTGELDAFLKWTPENYKNSKTETEFTELEKKVNEQIEVINNFCKTGLNSSDKTSLSRIEGYWKVSGPDQTRIVSTKNNYEKSEGVEYAVYNYYQLKWIYNKWKAFSEVFPGSKAVTEAKQKAEEVLNMLGSAENAKKHAQGAKEKRIAETMMEPAVTNDPELEAQIKKAVLNSKFCSGKTVVKVNIHSKNWGIQKHPISGVTLSRTKSYSAALKDKDGKCYLLHYTDFKQDYVGGNFGQGYIHLGEVVEILCKNVNN